MSKLIVSILTFFSVANVYAMSGGIQLSTSRIVFNEGSKAIIYGVTNEYNVPALASATITNFDGQPTSDFAVSPSLFQIQPQTTSQGQVVQLKPLVSDREIVYWLNVKTILSDEKMKENSGGTLQFAIGQRIKLFYRPKGITENCRAAAEGLVWKQTENGLKVINKSKVSVSIIQVQSGNKTYRIADTILPLSEKNWGVGILGGNSTFKYVDEYGNIVDYKLIIK